MGQHPDHIYKLNTPVAIFSLIFLYSGPEYYYSILTLFSSTPSLDGNLRAYPHSNTEGTINWSQQLWHKRL